MSKRSKENEPKGPKSVRLSVGGPVHGVMHAEEGAETAILELIRTLTNSFGEQVSVVIKKSRAGKLYSVTIQGDAARAVNPLTDSESRLSLIRTLKDRFKLKVHRHEDVQWEAFQAAMEANPYVMEKIYNMEAQGHEPDVFMQNAENYLVGTCADFVPSHHQHLVYDFEAEKALRGKSPGTLCHGNAVDIAAKMGARLMSKEEFVALQDACDNTGTVHFYGHRRRERKTKWVGKCGPDRDRAETGVSGSCWLATPEEVRGNNSAVRGELDAVPDGEGFCSLYVKVRIVQVEDATNNARVVVEVPKLANSLS